MDEVAIRSIQFRIQAPQPGESSVAAAARAARAAADASAAEALASSGMASAAQASSASSASAASGSASAASSDAAAAQNDAAASAVSVAAAASSASAAQSNAATAIAQAGVATAQASAAIVIAGTTTATVANAAFQRATLAELETAMTASAVGLIGVVFTAGADEGVYRKPASGPLVRDSATQRQIETTATQAGDVAASRQRTATLAAPFDGSDWIGPLSGGQLVFGADARDEGRFHAKHVRAETAARWPACVDFLGNGDLHFEVTAANQIFAVVDKDGVRRVWNDNGEVALPSVARELPGSALVEHLVEERVRAALRSQGLLPLPTLTPITVGPGFTAPEPFTLRADAANFSEFHFISQCIPTQALAYRPERPGQPCIRRLFRAEYGNRISPGTNGEQAPCWQRLSYVDIGDDGLPLIFRNGLGEPILDAFGQERPIRTDVCFVMRDFDFSSSNRGVIDSHIMFMDDGRLLYFIGCAGSGNRITYAAILNNPLTGTASTWDFGPWCPIGAGFTGQPRYIRGEIYATAANNMPVDPADDIPGIHRCELYRFHIGANSIIVPESIGIIPPQADRTLSSFQEASFAPFGHNGLLATFRVTNGQHMTRSLDGGRTWSPSVLVPGVLTASSKTSLALSPSGRMVWAHNNSLIRREPAVSISETLIDPAQPWVATKVLDPRANLSQSYMNVEFGRDRDGRYNDVIYISNDRTRGQTIDTMTNDWANWLVLTVVRESEVVAGTSTPIIYQEGLRV